jgi:hypothetical protein
VQDVLAGDDALAVAYGTVPVLEAGALAAVEPVRRLVLGARLEVTSRRTWPGYQAAEAVPASQAEARLPALWRLDLSATKRLWGDRLRASAALRNVLDERLRTHPAGSVQRLALFVRLDARF